MSIVCIVILMLNPDELLELAANFIFLLRHFLTPQRMGMELKQKHYWNKVLKGAKRMRWAFSICADNLKSCVCWLLTGWAALQVTCRYGLKDVAVLLIEAERNIE